MTLTTEIITTTLVHQGKSVTCRRRAEETLKGREGSAITSILWIAQKQNKGWLFCKDIIDYIAKFLDLPNSCDGDCNVLLNV